MKKNTSKLEQLQAARSETLDEIAQLEAEQAELDAERAQLEAAAGDLGQPLARSVGRLSEILTRRSAIRVLLKSLKERKQALDQALHSELAKVHAAEALKLHKQEKEVWERYVKVIADLRDGPIAELDRIASELGRVYARPRVGVSAEMRSEVKRVEQLVKYNLPWANWVDVA